MLRAAAAYDLKIQRKDAKNAKTTNANAEGRFLSKIFVVASLRVCFDVSYSSFPSGGATCSV